MVALSPLLLLCKLSTPGYQAAFRPAHVPQFLPARHVEQSAKRDDLFFDEQKVSESST